MAVGLGMWSAWRYRLPKGRPLLLRRQLLIGHRGCRRGQPIGEGPPPENTLEAFEYAVAKGAHGFELDTRFTKDGVPVVFHDARVGRCLKHGEASDPLVAELSLSELQRLPFRQAPSVRVPTLDEAVSLARRLGVQVLIETKDVHRPAELAVCVAELIRKHDMVDDALVISFDPRSLYHVRRADPGVRTCLLWVPGLVSGWAARGTEALPLLWRLCAPLLDAALVAGAHPALLPSLLGASAIGPSSGLRRTYLAAAQRRGMATYLWVVNDPELRSDVEGLFEEGLWAYSTDDLWPAPGDS